MNAEGVVEVDGEGDFSFVVLMSTAIVFTGFFVILFSKVVDMVGDLSGILFLFDFTFTSDDDGFDNSSKATKPLTAIGLLVSCTCT